MPRLSEIVGDKERVAGEGVPHRHFKALKACVKAGKNFEECKASNEALADLQKANYSEMKRQMKEKGELKEGDFEEHYSETLEVEGEEELEDEEDKLEEGGKPCPGGKIRSRGKGRGLGRGKGRGPIGTPINVSSGFLNDEEISLMEAQGFTVIREGALSVEGYLKGVQKALKKWQAKDIPDAEKDKIKALLKLL